MKKEVDALLTGVIGNTILTTMNVTAAISTGSLAFMAESLNTIGDICTSFLAYAGIKTSDKYPWVENVVGFIIGLVLCNLAFQIFNHTYTSVVSGELITMPVLLLIPAIGGFLLNVYITRRVHRIAHELESDGLHADAENQRTDIYGSFAIIVAIISSNLGIPYVDMIISLVIGVLVSKMAIETVVHNVNKLI